jgi:hypothetical protein
LGATVPGLVAPHYEALQVANRECRPSALQHPVAIGTNNRQVSQTRHPDKCGFSQWDYVMAFSKSSPQFSVEIKKVKRANLAGKPSFPPEHLLDLGSNHRATSLAGHVLPRQYLPCRESLFIGKRMPESWAWHFGCRTLNRLCSPSYLVRPFDEIIPHGFLELIVSRQAGLPMERVNPEEVAKNHRNAGRIAEVLVPECQSMNGQVIQQPAQPHDVFVTGG